MFVVRTGLEPVEPLTTQTIALGIEPSPPDYLKIDVLPITPTLGLEPISSVLPDVLPLYYYQDSNLDFLL